MKYKEVAYSNIPQEIISVIIIINFIYVSRILYKAGVKSQPWKESVYNSYGLYILFASK